MKTSAKRLQHSKLYAEILGIVVLFSIPILIKDEYFIHILIFAGIYIMLALSWNLLAGYAGQLNLGQAAFFGMGAYSAALLTLKVNLSPWLGLLAGGIAAGIFGVALGFPSLRLKGPYLAIVTIGFSETLRLVIMNWVSLTRGPLGLFGIPPLTSINIPYIAEFDFSQEKYCYYIIFLLVLLSIWIVNKLVKSRFGLILTSIREDEVATQSIGINTFKYKLLIFIISAFLAGVAGAFYAYYIRLISPEMLMISVTFTILSMAVIGGIGTIIGPIIGAVVLTFLSEGLRVMPEFRLIVYGLLLVLVILFAPKGLMGLIGSIINLTKRNQKEEKAYAETPGKKFS